GETLEVSLKLDPNNSGVPVIDSGLTEADTQLDDPSRTAQTDGDVDPTRRPSLVPAYILGGVTVVALGTAFVFRGLASGQRSKAEDMRTGGNDACAAGSASHCGELESAVSKHDTYAGASTVSLIVAGVGAAATIAYLTYALTKKESRSKVSAR